jgi:hypothetical protein
VNLETSKKERLPLRFSRRSYDVHIEAPHLIEIFMLRVRYILRGPDLPPQNRAIHSESLFL